MKKAESPTENFRDTPFDTAAEKHKVFKDLKRFIETGMPKERFTKKLYQHLSLHFGHIAHYNLDGFYETWFQTPKNQLDFLKKHRDEEIGSPDNAWNDVRMALAQWLKEKEIIGELEQTIREARYQHDLQLLEDLMGRYPSEARKIMKDLYD